jgi:hypothetical protein
VEVATTIHYYEAILACLAILVWHFYSVIFDPDVYPLNRECLDGRVSDEWMEEEHALAARPADESKTPPAAAVSHPGEPGKPSPAAPHGSSTTR